MSDAIKAILDAVTTRVLSYRPKDKGQQAKKMERVGFRDERLA